MHSRSITRILEAMAFSLGLAVFSAQAQGPASAPAPNGPGGNGPRGAGGQRGGFSFERLDSNKDGKITSDELTRTEIFDRLDTNKDGSITEEEFNAAREQLRGQRGGADNGPGSRPEMGRGNFGGDRGNFDITGMMVQRMRDRLGITDDKEWAVVEPKLKKVVELQMRTRLGGMMGGGMFGRGGGGRPGGGPDGGPQQDRPGMQNMTNPQAEELGKAVEDQNTPADKLASALQAFRDARKKSQDELKAAQDDLVKVLTPRQEAMLVMAGMLE